TDASLANNDTFVSAMQKVPGHVAAAAYIDVEALLDMVDQLLQTYAPNDAEKWARIRDAMNLRGIRRIAYTGGFEGRNWSDRLFVAAPAPRSGVALLLDAQPLDQQTLQLIPRDATLALASRLDLSRLLQEVQRGVARADQQTA